MLDKNFQPLVSDDGNVFETTDAARRKGFQPIPEVLEEAPNGGALGRIEAASFFHAHRVGLEAQSAFYCLVPAKRLFLWEGSGKVGW